MRDCRVSSSFIGYLSGPGAKRPTATSSPQSDKPSDLQRERERERERERGGEERERERKGGRREG